MPVDKWGNPYWYPTKSGGFNFEQSDNPKNDTAIEGLDSAFSVSGGVITMHPNGPTSFSVGKNARKFTDSIGGCGMDFKARAKAGYAAFPDDVRDLEFKCWMKLSGITSGFSMSSCTGHHTSSNCCQGFAYMGSFEPNVNPTSFRFRKETVHVEYTDSPESPFTHPKANFKINGASHYIGFGFVRYNKPTTGGTSPQDDSVILEIWFNPNPETDVQDWTMIKRIEDKKGKGWTGSKNKCNGDSDQIGVWSGAHNRLKTNNSGGTIQFKNISFREIDPFGTFETPPPPDPCPPGQHRDSNGGCVDDVPSGGGGSGGGGVPPPPTTTRVQGFLRLLWDINTESGPSACQGTGGGGGGGSGTLNKIYEVAAVDATTKSLSDSTAFNHRTRIFQIFNDSTAPQIGQAPKQIDVPLKKAGSPTSAVSVMAKIWSSSGGVIYTSPTLLDPTTLTTSYVAQTFDFTTNTHVIALNDKVGVEYKGTSDTNYVIGSYDNDVIAGSYMINFENSKDDKHPDRDMSMVIWS